MLERVGETNHHLPTGMYAAFIKLHPHKKKGCFLKLRTSRYHCV